MLFLVGISFLLGIFFRRTAVFPENSAWVLNRLILYVCVPAIILLHLREIEWTTHLFYPVLMPWLLIVFSVLFFLLLGKILNLSRDTIGCLILLGGLANTSFIGFPMVEAFYGKEGLPTALLVDQGGTFPVLTVFGTFLPIFFKNEDRKTWGELARETIFFPPFFSVIFALLFIRCHYPEFVVLTLQKLGDMLVPLALFSVGFQLHLKKIRHQLPLLSIGLGFKLILAPFFIWMIYTKIFHQTGFETTIILFESAMPPMISAGILAKDKNLNPELANLMVGGGVVFCFFTLLIWKLILP